MRSAVVSFSSCLLSIFIEEGERTREQEDSIGKGDFFLLTHSLQHSHLVQNIIFFLTSFDWSVRFHSLAKDESVNWEWEVENYETYDR